MYKPSTYRVVTYFSTYLPTYIPIYFQQNWLPRWNQILNQLRFIHEWMITDIQWMVHWWVLVHCGCLCSLFFLCWSWWCGCIGACVIWIRPDCYNGTWSCLLCTQIVIISCGLENGDLVSVVVCFAFNRKLTGKIRSRRILQQR
jgi:hypothetical protein